MKESTVKFWNNVLMLVIMIALITGAALIGQASAEPTIQRVFVNVDHELLNAARQYHGLSDDDHIYYIGDQLCFDRDGHTCCVMTGNFKYYYNNEYLPEVRNDNNK